MMDVNQRTLSTLGFDEVRAAMAAHCRTEVGCARARSRTFLTSKAAVQAEYALVEEARLFLDKQLSLPIGGLCDIRDSVRRAARGHMLEPKELLTISQSLIAFEKGSEMLLTRSAEFPGLAAFGRQLPVLRRLAARLEGCIEANGNIADAASVGLKEARNRAGALQKSIQERFDALLRDERFSATLQESYYSVRNGRYVVPVKASHQREIRGIVHNTSQTGQTLFVEPSAMVDLGNAFAIAQSLVFEEECKVLRELSELVSADATSLHAGIEAAAKLDELEAIARLAAKMHAAVPILEDVQGPLRLYGLRHPRLVLQDKAVVANDVVLQDARVLVISGPNAGGKTVTLTGLGLCALMVQAALPIPAQAHSCMPLFPQIHSCAGDAQDLQQGLSTFSAHVTTLRDIVQSARQGCLVLIDEVASNTNPREGAALAAAVLEHLLELGAFVVATTHLEELKALAYFDKRFVNARVGFDAHRMTPTYRLQFGLSGASSAIDIARRVGLPEKLCARAAALVVDASGAFAQAAAAAEEAQQHFLRLRDEAEKHARDMEAAKAQAHAESQAAQRVHKEEALHFRAALKAELGHARKHIQALVKTLETSTSLSAVRAAEKELKRRIDEQEVAERQLRGELRDMDSPQSPVSLTSGTRVYHVGLDIEAEILDVTGEYATVVAGVMRMRVPVVELRPSRQGKAPFKPSPVEAGAAHTQLGKYTCDVRGQRTEVALRTVEAFLDSALQQGAEEVIVLHGHGTGATRRALRAYLRTSPYAKDFGAGDGLTGGEAVTVVTLA